MFGMSSTEFWEEDPQLYWAYRTFYLKKKETEYEEMRYSAWLNGSMNYIGVSLSLNNAFSKQRQNYPSYDELLKDMGNKKDEGEKKDANIVAQEQFNAWARY